MPHVSWNTTLTIAAQSLVVLGVTGAATQYITKSAIQLYNRVCPTAYKIEDKTAEKTSNIAAAVISCTVGVGMFMHKLFMEKYGRSDEMPADIFQEFKDKKFLKKMQRLLPHLMPKTAL